MTPDFQDFQGESIEEKKDKHLKEWEHLGGRRSKMIQEIKRKKGIEEILFKL